MTDAAYNDKTVAVHPQAGSVRQHVTLPLRPTEEPLQYLVRAGWGESRDGEFEGAAVEKHVAVSRVQRADGLETTVEWVAPPVLQKKNPLPFDAVTLLLAQVYQRLVLATSPAGQFLALRNHAEIVGTWTAVRQQLGHHTDDETAAGLRAALDGLVPDGSALLASLRFDYFFSLFFKNVCHQRFETFATYTQRIGFPQFFSDVSVGFVEQMTLEPSTAPEPFATLTFSSQVDEAATDRAAVAGAIAERLGNPLAPAPAALHFTYDATCVLDKASGLPVALDVAVTCGARPRYQKEYTLTVRRI